MRLAQTVAFRLFVLIVSVQTVVLAALTFATVRIQHAYLMDHVLLAATRVSHVIVRSTRHSMLLNRKEDVHSIVASVGGEPGIEGLRIYNKQGEIIFGTVPADLHTVVDLNAEACVSCHTSLGLEHPQPMSEQLSRIFSKPGGDRVLGLITPIRNEPQCSDAACHAHPPDKTILGVLDVKMNLANVDAHLAESRDQLIVLSVLAVLAVSLISGGFILFVVHYPVRKLTEGMKHVSGGNLNLRLETSSKDELGELARTFNSMTADLAHARAEITAWSSTLEQKVWEKTADLEKAHGQMVRVEKMASLGNLAATVAHELNNPLEGILTFAKLLIKRIRKSGLPPAEVQPYVDDLTLVADEAHRSGTIVKNLLAFARQGGGSFESVDLSTVLHRCELLMKHHAAMHNVELLVHCPSGTVVECDAHQIQQALVALMVNAMEAMGPIGGRNEGGRLTVEVVPSPSADCVDLNVRDTGIGMTDEVRAHIFEPFFTTKSEVKGVGLGLAVVYGIVQRHNGTIEVESSSREGTTFTITLPLRQPEEHSQSSEAPSIGEHAS